MGLLDDAIRDHLELKRRRGADPAEIERAERDALGPARRNPDELSADVEPYEFEEPPYPEHEEWQDADAQPLKPAYAPPGDDLGESSPEIHADLDVDQRDEDRGSEGLADTAPTRAWTFEPEGAPPEDGYAQDRPEELETGFDASDVEVPIARDEIPLPNRDEQPLPSSDEHALPNPDEQPGAETEPHEPDPPEDVLEETPDFLQDTPDHDRLWFEQRPPRDFDFGG